MSKKITFIIVEDEALFSLHLARQLHRKGYDVIGRFVSDEQAVDYTRKHIPTRTCFRVLVCSAGGTVSNQLPDKTVE